MRLLNTIFFLSFFLRLESQNGVVHSINSIKDISSLNVYSNFIDSKGQMWFCTDKGISLYNGISVINYNQSNGLPDNEVFSIFEDSEGRLWPTTLKGELFYILNNKIITQKEDNSLIKLNNLIVKDKFYTRYIYQINNDTIYFCSSINIYKYSNNKTSHKFSINHTYDYISYIYQNNKTLYATTNEGIIELYSGKLITSFLMGYGHEKRFKICDSILYFFNGNSIYKIMGTKIEKVFQFKEINQITSFSFLNKFTLLLSSNDGFYIYDIPHKTLSEVEELKHSQVSAITVDVEKNIWITTLIRGVYMINNLNYQFYKNNNGASALLSNNNNIYLGDIEGNVKIINKETHHFEYIPIQSLLNNHLSSNNVKSLAIDGQGFLWIGYSEQIIKYNLKTGLCKSINAKVKNLETDTKKNVWATTYAGIALANDAEELNIKTYFNDPTIANYRFYGFCEDSLYAQYYISHDNIFITYKNGIQKQDTLPSRIALIKTKNQKLFWILNQDNGLWVYDRINLKKIVIKTHLGMPGICNDLFLQNDSTLWVCYNSGYSKIEIRMSDRSLKNQKNYKLLINTRNTNNTKIIYDNGTIYLATENGLVSVKEKDLKNEPYNIPLLINDINVNGENTEIKNYYDLKPKQNNITIKFIGLYYQNFGNVNYRYRFKENNGNWLYTSANTLEFSNLNYGYYTLVINACDKYGNWSKYYSTIVFNIAKPFYLQKWFIFFMLIVVIATLFFLIKIYLNLKNNKIQKQLDAKTSLLQAKIDLIETQKNIFDLERKKTEAEQKMFMAQVNPHFIFNAINSIQTYILNNNKLDAYDYLQKFSTLMRSILVNSKNLTVTVNEDLKNLKLYLEIESLRFNNKLNFKFDYTKNEHFSKKIPSMLLQPYVENSIWHGIMPKQQSGTITINVVANTDYLNVTITDDGIGRKASSIIKSVKTGTGSGLKLSENRLKLYSDELGKPFSITIADIVNNQKIVGTVVVLKIPLTK